MRKNITFLFVLCFSIFSGFAQNKECDCSDALDTALKNKYTDTQLLDLRIELYEYYKFIQNKSDNTNINFSLSSAGEAYTGYGLFSGSSDNSGGYEKTKIRNLQKIIEKDQRISEQVFKQIVTDVFSDNQLQAYQSCLDLCKEQSSTGVFYEVSGDLEDVFALKLQFTNSIFTDINNVTLSKNATLINCEPIGGLVLKEDLEIKTNQSIIQYLKIIDKSKSAQIGINFDELSFDAINFGDEYIGGSKHLPIGTIISSTFKYETFLEVNRFKPTENMSKAIWVPCDGRDVRSSDYGKFSGSVPDLRGLFLRNVNDYKVPFDGVAQVSTEQANPENTSAGVFQKDEVGRHKHGLTVDSDSGAGGGSTFKSDNQVRKTNYTKDYEGNETRPKNMTVYYYIKINR